MRATAVAAALASLAWGFLTLSACSEATEPARTVFVVRHAEAWKNVDAPPDLTADQLDTLTPRGEAQTRRLGAELADRGATLVIHSPTGRTTATARGIADAIGAELVASAALAPLALGRTPDGEPETWDAREARWTAGDDPRPSEGESMADGVARARAAILAATDHRRLVLVTHGDIAAGLLGAAAGTAMPARFSTHAPPGGSVTTIHLTDAGDWQLGATWTPPD